MAVLEVIRNFFIPSVRREVVTVIEPAPPTTYTVRPLVEDNLDEVLRLNFRCFKDGENYTKHTFSYLLTQSNALCYQTVTAEGKMAGFICVLVGEENSAHVTTIAVAPEHRRRRLAERLLTHLETALLNRGVTSIVLEVRAGNTAAQELYKACGFYVLQRLSKYYNNGEDGLLMMKGLR